MRRAGKVMSVVYASNSLDFGISVMKRTEAFALRLLLPESDPEFDTY
jgi:hypothetical protein